MHGKILIVDDEAPIREMVTFALRRANYESWEAPDAESTLVLLNERQPDLILLDWMLPGMSGIDLTRRLKKDLNTRALPIIMLTAKGAEADRIRGLEVGADDYIAKPFSPRELLARIKAVLRRAAPQAIDNIVAVRNLKLDPVSHRIFINEELIETGPTEFRMLHFFMTHPERVYSRNQLLDMVWGNNVYVEERTIDVHIRRLRKILEPFGYDNLIQTVRGAGYRLSLRD